MEKRGYGQKILNTNIDINSSHFLSGEINFYVVNPDICGRICLHLFVPPFA